MFNNAYQGKRVLVTGHTGFKGSWLCAWLLQLGAEVAGFSIDVPTDPSHFEALNLKSRIHHVQGDIRDHGQVRAVMEEFAPDFVFHLAAQAIVRRSFQDPVMTFETNALGTLNILDCIRQCPSVAAGVIVTSDKCYRNMEWPWGYRESDILGGSDPYSASKGCAELILHSYLKTYFQDGPRLASARAGNVIGGGDWAQDRLVPDAVRAWSREKSLAVRHPEATRPWQHVLEPLSGYLCLGARLFANDPLVVSQAFNFGPNFKMNQSVQELLSQLSTHWHQARWDITSVQNQNEKETTLLMLNSDKALGMLGWSSVLTFAEEVAMTAVWYKTFYEEAPSDMTAVTFQQIKEYSQKADKAGMWWAGYEWDN